MMTLFVFADDLYNEAYCYYQNRINNWGHSKHKSPMITINIPNNKWAEHNWFLCDHYLPFAIGGGYIISANPIHKITITSDYLQLYNSEDISVSVWLSAYKIILKGKMVNIFVLQFRMITTVQDMPTFS